MSDTNNTPQDRIRIFNREGLPVAEFRAAVERSWAIGEEGRAFFEYASRKTDIVNDTVLRFGNWLLVENDSLPPWVGVIDTPRKWGMREVQVFAYGPERVFGWRRGVPEEKLNNTAGGTFEYLLKLINTEEQTILRPGEIWRESNAFETTINPDPLSNYLSDLSERVRGEYAWRPVVGDNGRLIVYADWFANIGEDTDGLLHEGIDGGNIEAVGNVMVEDGDIINDFLAIGDGLTWSSRPTAHRKDNESLERYGLRQAAEEYSGVSEQSTLRNHAKDKLADFSEPARTFHLNAINKSNTFQYLSLGNRMTLQFQSIGFIDSGTGYQTQIRILGMSYNPELKNVVELVVEEVR